MADDATTIPLDDGSDSSSVSVDLDPSQADETPGSAAPAEATSPDVTALQRRLDELNRLNEQYKRERRGWEEQSRRNLEERNAMAERFARLEGQLAGLAQGTAAPPPPPYAPGLMTAAMEKYMSGDASALTAAEQAMWSTIQQQTKTAAQPTLSAEDIRKIILDELVTLGTKGNVQTIVGTNHPDMANPQSELSRDVWDAYDTYLANHSVQLLYPRNPQYEVPMIGPDGDQRLVDARVVDRLAADIRLRKGQQEGRRQEQRAASVGTAMNGAGQTTKAPAQRAIAAIDLLSQGELDLLASPEVRKGWKTLPQDPKAAAKFIFDKLPDEEKQRRIQAYRSRARVTT